MPHPLLSTLARAFLFAAICAIAQAHASATKTTVFNVPDFGAAGDGVALDTAPLQRAIDACALAGGGTVRLPEGRYLSATLRLCSNLTLHLENDAILLGSPNAADYPILNWTYPSNPSTLVVPTFTLPNPLPTSLIRGILPSVVQAEPPWPGQRLCLRRRRSEACA